MVKDKTIICLMGPTAVGKTSLAIQLARDLPCEIISVDSGMVYRGMDIGTAKPTKEELAIAPHHLINISDPSQAYSVATFCADAKNTISAILQRGKIPLLVGGTMLYFKMLQQGISNLPAANPEIRAELGAQAARDGWETLHAKLQLVDQAAATRISVADTQRIQRALEVYAITGKTMTELCELDPPQQLPYNVLNFALMPDDRDLLRSRISDRLEQMLRLGLIDEVAALRKRSDLHADMPALRAVGYRQVWHYLDGNGSLEDLREQIYNATNQLAKRQLTWLRSWDGLQKFGCAQQIYARLLDVITKNII